MKKLIYLMAAACLLGTASCEKDDNGKTVPKDLGFGTTEAVQRQATRIELKTTGVSFPTQVQSAGVEYRATGEKDWQPTAGSLSTDRKTLTTRIIGLDENTEYEYRVWAKGESMGTVSAKETATVSTRRYYEIEYTSNERIEGIFATLSFSGVAFYENGVQTEMNAYQFSYRKAGDTEWITQAITPAQGSFTVALPAEGTLSEETGYEYNLSCDYYTQAVTDSYAHKFETTKAAVNVTIHARSVVGTASGVICAAEVSLTLDGKQPSLFDACSVEYREKGTQTWSKAEGTKINERSLQATIPAATLTVGKTYEYRYNVDRQSTTWTESSAHEFRYGAQEVSKIAGQWKLYSFNGSTELSYIIYLNLTAANRFDLYQHFTQPAYDKFSGTISVMNDSVSGIYDDGMVWGTSYTLETIDSNTMKWTSLEGANDVSIYKRSTIPDTILKSRTASVTPEGERFL